MVIRREDGRLLLFRQVDHGVLAGHFAEVWGNDAFAAPTPREAVLLAAAQHDEGWRLADDELLFNADAERPQALLEIEMRDHVPLYRRGVEAVLEQDAYAGLLVSMHWTGLYRQRWGLQQGMARWGLSAEPTPTELLIDEAVLGEERRWIDLKRELTRDAVRTDFEAELWHNFDLLQAFDLLSLFVCLHDGRADDGEGEAQPVGATLRDLDPLPGPRVIPAVPPAVAAQRTTLTLRAAGEGVVSVDPWPFGPDALDVEVPATAIPDVAYADQDAARAAVADGEAVTVACRMVRA
jgi:hypothetical protein